jgi:hypothetical protein
MLFLGSYLLQDTAGTVTSFTSHSSVLVWESPVVLTAKIINQKEVFVNALSQTLISLFFSSPSKKYMTNNKSAKENYTQNKRGEIKKHRNIVFLCVLVLIYKVNRNVKGACILSDMPKHVNCVNIHKDGHHYCSSSWRSSFIILLWSRHGAEI